MKKFLINKFGKEQGEKLYIKQQKRYYKLVEEAKVKSKSQIKTLKSVFCLG